MQDFLTFEQVVEMLNITPPTLYKYLNQKLIDGYKIGGKWKFTKEQVEDYIERCRNLREDEEPGQDDHE